MVEYPLDEEKLKQFIETVYRLNRERGWGSRMIAKFIGGVSHTFIHKILQFGSPEDAYEYYVNKVKKTPRQRRRKLKEVLAKIETLSEVKEEDLEKFEKSYEEEKIERSYEERLSRAGARKVLTELTKRTTNLSLQHLKRIIENGLLVDEILEDVWKEREEILKRIAVEERLKREILNEGLIYLLAGKIDREKFARLLLATEFM